MKATILSNLVIDEIISADLNSTQSLGGPAAYCGITARKFGFDTTLFTHFGKDFNSEYLEYLKKEGISLNASNPQNPPTTRFIKERGNFFECFKPPKPSNNSIHFKEL